VFEVVAESNQGWQRAHFVSRPDYKGHISSPKGTVPLGRGLVKTLTHTTSGNLLAHFCRDIQYFLAKKVYKGWTNLWSCCC